MAHVDSDVFDSFSKQLIPAETLLPDVRRRLEAVNAAILTEETSTKVSVLGSDVLRVLRSVHSSLSRREFVRHP